MNRSIPERLKAVQERLTEKTWEDFEDALAEIDTADVALLPALYECFVDGAAMLPLMWQLLHLIEDFEEEASLLSLIEKTSYLQEHAPDWLAIVWTRTLNSVEVRARLQYEILPLLNYSDLQHYLLTEPVLQPKARQLFAD